MCDKWLSIFYSYVYGLLFDEGEDLIIGVVDFFLVFIVVMEVVFVDLGMLVLMGFGFCFGVFVCVLVVVGVMFLCCVLFFFIIGLWMVCVLLFVCLGLLVL